MRTDLYIDIFLPPYVYIHFTQQAQGGMERGRAYWFGEDEKKGEEGMVQGSSHESRMINGKSKGLKSSSQVVTATTSSNGKP